MKNNNNIPQIWKLALGAAVVLGSAQSAFAAKALAPVVTLPPMAAFAIDSDGAVLVADADSDSVVRIVPGAEPEVLVGPDSGLYQPNSIGFDGMTLYIADERGVFEVVNNSEARTASVELKKVKSFVKAGPKLPFVKITAPALLTHVELKKEVAIRWAHNLGAAARFHVELSRDGGSSWETLANDVKGTSYVWKATLPETELARIRVSEVEELTPENRASVSDLTDDVLYILYPAE